MTHEPSAPDPFDQLRTEVARWVDLPEDAWAALRALFRPVTVERLGYVLAPGEAPHHVVFVASGLLRYFSGRRGGRALNKAFLDENTLSPPITGCSITPGLACGLQALEPSTVLVADSEAFEALHEAHPVLDRLGRRLGEWWLEQKEARALGFQDQDATERYLSFVAGHPDLVQRVSQGHIASYLGITEVSLSRIRGQMARRPRTAARV